MLTVPVPWLISTSAPVVLVKLAVGHRHRPADIRQAQRVGAAGDVHLIDRDGLRQPGRGHRRDRAGREVHRPSPPCCSPSVTVPVSVGRVPASDRQAVQGEGRALPVQRLVGVQRDIAGGRRAARVDVDRLVGERRRGRVRERVERVVRPAVAIAAALFTYQTTFDRLIVTVPVLVTPLPSVSV